MRYQIIEERGLFVIKIFGDTENNEALKVKGLFSPYLTRKGVRVIVDLNGVNRFEPVNLLGVLNSIKKQVDFSKGDLRVRSLRPEVLSYLKGNRLDRIFQLSEDEEEPRKGP